MDGKDAGRTSLFVDMSEEEKRAFFEDVLASMRVCKCGTPFIRALERAVDDFHDGLPVGPDVSVGEVVLLVHDDWKRVGVMFTVDGTQEEIYAPRVDVEGGEENITMITEKDITGFIPERGHSYRLRARCFQLIRKPFYRKYELLEVLEDRLL